MIAGPEVAEWHGHCAGTDSAPLITIVTATMNAAATLPITARSLAGQHGADFEWIVADGASTDGTLDYLSRCEMPVCWTSAPDRGIYDAWNKACRRARGEWLLFLGAGD